MIRIFFITLLTFLYSCTTPVKNDKHAATIDEAAAQYDLFLNKLHDGERLLNPRTVNKDGSVRYASYKDWTSGFFPGSLWYLYKLTGDEKWKKEAIMFTETLDSAQYITRHHDVGFIVGCSFLNGIRLGKKDYSSVIVQTAKSLSTRFRPQAGIIQSWNVDRGWQSEKGWECPVIIDNMMNLELMFEASIISKDTTFYNIAVSHADKTLENHFRPDNSCYHVIDYSLTDGSVRKKCTAQGYSDESAWARGQAWALYGYVVCYRYTKDLRYLHQANKVYDFIFGNKNLPEDLVPYWDYNAPNIPNEPRDVSSAAVVASALYEMSNYIEDKKYVETADKILESLEKEDYRAKVGTNGNFILMHSVGSIPHGFEIDVPLNYADYYFLEALYRRSELKNN